jgi:putative transposase
MRRSRFSDGQIVGFVREHEAGGGTADICRRAGITPQTLYRWKAKYGGLQVSDAKRLRSLEDENARLKRLVAEQALDNQVLKDLLRKNS